MGMSDSALIYAGGSSGPITGIGRCDYDTVRPPHRIVLLFLLLLPEARGVNEAE
jgi:hypothetical protein